MIKVDIDYNGKPVNVLARLVEERARVTGESIDKCVYATAINAIKSIRADTRVANKNLKRKIALSLDEDLKSGWAGKRGTKQHWRVARAEGTGRPSTKAMDIYAKSSGDKSFRHSVYGYTIDKKGGRTRYIIADTEEEALDNVPSFQHLLRFSGACKNCWTKAMKSLHAASVPSDGAIGTDAESLASRCSSVKEESVSNSINLKVTNALRYAGIALRHGEEYTDIAMKKAANKTAAIITRWIKAHKSFEDIPVTPFPEVVGYIRRKVS